MYFYSLLKVDKTPSVDAETSLGMERLSKPLMTAVPIIRQSLVLQCKNVLKPPFDFSGALR